MEKFTLALWHTCTHAHAHTHTHTYTPQEVRSGKFEMYDYGSAEDNMKHYGVVSARCVLGGYWKLQGVCVGRVLESVGCVCVGRVLVSAGCVCWEGTGKCRVCVLGG